MSKHPILRSLDFSCIICMVYDNYICRYHVTGHKPAPRRHARHISHLLLEDNRHAHTSRLRAAMLKTSPIYSWKMIDILTQSTDLSRVLH